MSASDPSLSPYPQCPAGQPEACRFGEPVVASDATSSAEHSAARVHVCAVCGHGVTRPPIADVSRLYEARDTQDFRHGEARLATVVKGVVFDAQARHLLRSAPRPPRTVVDFGCGGGLLTARLTANAPAGGKVIGLDFFDAPPAGLAGADYRSFRDLAALAGTADLLLCFHALEHDDDPDRFLARLLALLAPGGLLVIEVPNVACVWAKILGAHWDNWYLPRHRVHFSRESLSALLRRHGLVVEREEDVCVPSMGRSLARMLGRKPTLPLFALGIALHPLQWALEKLFRAPSAIRVYVSRAG